MDFLVNLFNALLSFCAGLVGLTVLVSFIVLALRSHQDGIEKKRAAWRKLAAATGLTFVPGHFFEIGTIAGDYKGWSFKMDTCNKNSGNSSQIYTRLTLAAKDSAYQNRLEETLFKEDVVTLLSPDLDYQGGLKVQSEGREIRYEEPGDEIPIDYLQYLFDWLVDLADAYPAIVALGGEIVPTLKMIAKEDPGMLRPTVYQLIRSIGRQTTRRLGYRFTQLICSACLTRCQVHKVRLHWWESVTYYGCRTCGQSRKLFSCPQGVTVVLDSTRPAAYNGQTGPSLEINWLAYRELFDFDRVEIIQANDEEVERFAVQVGNDTDPVRRSRYKSMECVLGPDCRLSANTQRILRHTFGQVVQASNGDVTARQPAVRAEVNLQFREHEMIQAGEVIENEPTTPA